MRISSKIKKTISVASLLAISSTASALPRNTQEALDQLTGPNQPSSGTEYSMCVSVMPYFLSPMTGGPGHFWSLLIEGSMANFYREGKCSELGDNGKCERGFIKITTTAPI